MFDLDILQALFYFAVGVNAFWWCCCSDGGCCESGTSPTTVDVKFNQIDGAVGACATCDDYNFAVSANVYTLTKINDCLFQGDGECTHIIEAAVAGVGDFYWQVDVYEADRTVIATFSNSGAEDSLLDCTTGFTDVDAIKDVGDTTECDFNQDEAVGANRAQCTLTPVA
tara:strand:- start:7984 stop:8490 length:507 start_codon:yes stop_codon:yes gene_type:complete